MQNHDWLSSATNGLTDADNGTIVCTATLDLIVEYFRGRPGVEVLNTSAGQGDGSPIGFYERYGFERTGEVRFGEVMLRLTLLRF